MHTIIKTSVLAALAGLALASQSAQAFTYNPGDVFLGFRQDGNSTADFVVDIGPGTTAATFASPPSNPYVFTISGLDAKLDAIFGNNWETNSTVTFALFGTTSNTGTGSRVLTISEPTGETAPNRAFNQSGPTGAILALKDYYQSLTETPGISNSSQGDPADSSSFTTEVMNQFNSQNLGIIEGTVAGGLDLYRLPQAPNGTPVPGTLLGNLKYTATNQFTFNSVPEPNTGWLFCTSLGLAGFVRLRRLRVA